jgi:hypothetical protein
MMSSRSEFFRHTSITVDSGNLEFAQPPICRIVAGQAAPAVVRIGKLRVVERVEEFRPEPEGVVLQNFGSLQDRNIEFGLAGPE